MKQFVKLALPIAVFSLFVGTVFFVSPDTALAIDPSAEVQDGVRASGGGSGGGADLRANIKIVTNTLLFILGAVAVIMIVLGGIKYTISNGDTSQVTSAKNTILYAVIGLIVAILAYAIVNFVIDRF
jgi:hypothetical protein